MTAPKTTKGPESNGTGPAPRVIDLNVARAARAEAQPEPVTLIVGTAKLTLPVELPYDYAEFAMEGELRKAINCLLDDEDTAREFWSQHISIRDVEEIVTAINDAYGLAPGEPLASPRS